MSGPGGRAPAARDGRIAVGLFAGTLALYAFTMPRTVTMEDSGLFLMSARYAATAHSPGFPVYTMLGHLFSLLPFGNVAVRVHLFSASCGAGGAALLYLCGRRLGLGAAAAILAALLLALSPAYWSQSIVAEVYALNALFTVACLACVLRFRDGGSRGWLWLAGGLLGLGLGNHWPLMVLVTPGLLCVLGRRLRETRAVLGAAVVALAAAAPPYAFLIARSFRELPYNFLSPIYSAEYFWSVVSRAAYADMYHAPLQERWWNVEFYGHELRNQFTAVGVLLMAVGCLWQWRRFRSGTALGLTALFAATTLVLAWTAAMDYTPMARATQRAYALPAYAVGALWVALVLERWLLVRLGARAALGVVGALGLTMAALHFEANDRRADTLAAEYGRAMLASLEPDAILFTSSEMDAGPIGYLHLVEGVRPDVRVYCHQGLFFPGGPYPSVAPEADRRRLLEQFIRDARRPVHLVGELADWPGGLADPLPFGRRDHGLYRTVHARWPAGRQGLAPLPELDAFVARALDATDEKDPFAEHLRDLLASEYGRLVAPIVLETPGTAAADSMQAQLERLRRNYRGLITMLDTMHRKGDPETLWEWAEQARRMEQQHRYHYRFRAHVAYLRGVILLRRGPEHRAQARAEFEASLAIMSEQNPAAAVLESLEAADPE